ncbi:MAG: outer membrane beta-barrel protein [Verrucomicrobium sp.]|nr:outer membrane beta-barrel protein [Verrucomicrobium sp.]
MRKSFYLALALAAGLILSAHAGDDSKVLATQTSNERMDGFFAGVQGGADFSGDIHTSTGADISSNTLALGGIKGGYVWNRLPILNWKNFTNRIELEADWSGDHRALGATGFSQNNAIVLINQSVGYQIGKFEPYVGGSVGFINTWVSGGGFGNSSDISLAYGPLAGLRYNIDAHWQVYGEYKYLFSDDKSYSSSTGATINTHTGHDQLATAGVSYFF